jgi:indole-3-glycerol phosphate synthase
MSILSDIVAVKRKEIEEQRSLYPVKLLERSLHFETPVVSLKKYILRSDRNGIIAEIKRRSPASGTIHAYADVEQTSIGYMQAGASALSILTDKTFFGGSPDDLRTARRFNFCPILRKDFILDEYQIVESKSIGADAVLLIAALLDSNRMQQLYEFAETLVLEVVVEIHTEEELVKMPAQAELVGINSRDLRTFEVSVDRAVRLNAIIGRDAVRIAESGIGRPEDVVELRASGFQGFLIGETFMRNARPELACREFIGRLRQLESTSVEN